MSTPERAFSKRLVRPTLDTQFHIDYGWWDRADRDLEVYLRSHLCAEHQETYADMEPGSLVDHVDPETAEVTRGPGLQHVLISHCAQQPDYVTAQTTLVNAIFRIFLANGNQPLTATELGDRLARPAQMILRTLSGPRVYKGMRPFIEN